MKLNKLGDLIEIVSIKNNGKYDQHYVRGISNEKKFIKTKADLLNVDLSNFNVVPNNHFSFNPNTARMGDKVSIALNETCHDVIVSSIYPVFKIKDENVLSSKYLMIYFKRNEFDRYVRYNSWGSAREVFTYEDFCKIELYIPPIEVQKKYVAVYEGLKKNFNAYIAEQNSLKLLCDSYCENIKNCISAKVGKYIQRNSKRNEKNKFTKFDVKGFNNEGEFIKPMRLFSGNISTFKIISKNDFVYNSRINSNIQKLSIAINTTNDDLIVSPAYESFCVVNTEELYPYYLYMLLQRNSFAKKVLFNSFGSSTIVFTYFDLCEICIPVPDIKTQKNIADIYMIYVKRKAFIDKLKWQMNHVCSILIKGSIEDARRT